MILNQPYNSIPRHRIHALDTSYLIISRLCKSIVTLQDLHGDNTLQVNAESVVMTQRIGVRFETNPTVAVPVFELARSVKVETSFH